MNRLLPLLLLALPALTAATVRADGSPADDLAEEKRLSSEYLAQMAAEPGTRPLEAGVLLRPLFDSHSGRYPTATDTVQVGYLLTDREGKTLDESITADEIATFPLGKLIRCWQIALPKVAVGSFYKLSCPSDTAYGDQGITDLIKGGAALTFRVTLYGIAP
jgi:FKBP-type peptidyl-prolyl cis-trans isomerase